MRSLPAVLLVLLGASPLAADEVDDALKAALGREIIGPRQALAEVEDFTESRVPTLPAVQTADEWTRLAARLRADVLQNVIFRGQAAAWRDAKTKVEWLDTIEGGPGYCIKKLRFEAVPGLWVPALLYEPDVIGGKVPVVLNVNGHDAKGKAVDYKQVRCINLAKRGIVALNLEWFGMGQLRGDGFRHGLINAIDLCGTSGVSLHYLALSRGLDILLDHPDADPTRVAVTGLSGGGWQTIFFSPLDTRVTLTNPVAGYSSFRTRARHHTDLGDSEQTPSDLATVVDYIHLTAMMAPRPTLLTFNAKDNCCFAAGHALPPLREAVAPLFRLFDNEKGFRTHVNDDPGDHNYGLDNRQAFYRMLGDHWFAGQPRFDPKEIPSDGEVKTADTLTVPLPDDNLDFHRLATTLAQDLPTRREPAADGERQAARDRLRAIVRPYEDEIGAEKVAEDDKGGLKATFWKLRLGRTWTVPAVDLSRGESKGAVVVINDAGRKDSAGVVKALLDEGKRVIAIDLFYFGEAKIQSRDYLFALLVAAVGERPLGLQTGQLLSVATWARGQDDAPTTIIAVGPRSSTIALVAAVLDEKAIGGVELQGALGSLKDLIAQKKEVNFAPELFCFGLLEAFDLPQLEALVAPRPTRRREADKAP